MKIGVSLKIDVKKIDKARLFAAQSGALYVDLTMFLDTDNVGQYGDHGFITQSTTKEEREQNVQMPILGNGKIFYGIDNSTPQQAPQQGYQNQQNPTYQQAVQAQAPRDAQGFTAKQGGFQQQVPKVNPQEPVIDFNDDIPFAPIGLQYRSILNCM